MKKLTKQKILLPFPSDFFFLTSKTGCETIKKIENGCKPIGEGICLINRHRVVQFHDIRSKIAKVLKLVDNRASKSLAKIVACGFESLLWHWRI